MATTAVEVTASGAPEADAQPDDEATEATAVSDSGSGAGWVRRHRGVLVLSGLGVAIVGLVALGVVQFVRIGAANHSDSLRAGAVQAADQMVVNLTSMSASTEHQDMTKLMDGATGSFRAEFSQQAQAFEQVLSQSKVTSTGRVVESGLVSADDNNAVALTAVTATVKNTDAPNGQQRVYRMRVTLQHQGNQWLVSNLEFVP
jgi:Mce-associated membrane protein